MSFENVLLHDATSGEEQARIGRAAAAAAAGEVRLVQYMYEPDQDVEEERCRDLIHAAPQPLTFCSPSLWQVRSSMQEALSLFSVDKYSDRLAE